MCIHTGLHDAVDIGKGASIVQESIDGNLVGGIEHTRHGATRFTRALGERKTTERIHVGSIKGKLT